jgi:transcriptional regulator with AAA-type ATPase domain
MPIDLQPKLLRALEEEEIRPVGSSESITYDIRFIFASNKDLTEETKKGRFREDLLYRFPVLRICAQSVECICRIGDHTACTDHFPASCEGSSISPIQFEYRCRHHPDELHEALTAEGWA